MFQKMEHDQSSSSSGSKGLFQAKHKVKIFQHSWLQIEEFKGWLTSHPDNRKAFCTACNTVLACGISELRKHANRKRHIFNLKEDQIKYDNNPSALLTKKVNSKGHIEDVKRAEIKLAAFFAEHNIALRTLDHMVPLLKNIYNKPEIANDLSLSRKKCTKIITNVIGKRESEKSIEILRKQRFSILIDESTTISNDKVLVYLLNIFTQLIRKL